MNPSRLFILRPVGDLAADGGDPAGRASSASSFLPLSALPEVDYPTIQVQTFYPGASPEVMTSSVTAPLERQFGQMPGLNQMSSISSAGASVITLQFSLDLSLDVAEQEVQAAINAAGNLLPSDLPAPPIYAKVNPADAPILTLALTSKTLPLTQVEDLADTRLAQKISQHRRRRPGHASAAASARRCASRPTRARWPPTASTSTTCAPPSATPTSTRRRATSTGRRAPTRSTPTTSSRAPTTTRDLIIAYRNGAPVRLSRRRRRRRGRRRTPSSAPGRTRTPAVILNIQRQPGANVIAVVDSIKALLPQLQAGAAGRASTSTVLTDRTTTIRASVHDVEFELVLAVVLVVLVIFLFLRNVPATFIPSLSVPLSLVGTLRR